MLGYLSMIGMPVNADIQFQISLGFAFQRGYICESYFGIAPPDSVLPRPSSTRHSFNFCVKQGAENGFEVLHHMRPVPVAACNSILRPGRLL